MSRRNRSEHPGPAPDVVRELAALDAALDGRAQPGDDLGDLVAVVREQRPRPQEAWGRELDQRVASGFGDRATGPGRSPSPPPRRRGIDAWLRGGSRWRLLAPGVATLGPLLLVAVVLTAGSGTRGRPIPTELTVPPSAAGPAVATSSSSSATQGSGGTPRLARPTPLSGLGTAPLGIAQGRRVHRTVAVTLAAPAPRIADTADGVVRVTDAFGGIVQSSNVNTGDGGSGGASFDLRLPADRLGPALDALSRLAHVRSRSDQSEDITKPFDDATAVVADATAARDGLRRQLAGAPPPPAAASLRAALAAAEDRLRASVAQLASLRQASDLVAVSVDIEPARAATSAPSPGSWNLGDAAAAALGILVATAGVLLIALAVALPIAAAAGLGLVLARVWRQRARERALGTNA